MIDLIVNNPLKFNKLKMEFNQKEYNARIKGTNLIECLLFSLCVFILCHQKIDLIVNNLQKIDR